MYQNNSQSLTTSAGQLSLESLQNLVDTNWNKSLMNSMPANLGLDISSFKMALYRIAKATMTKKKLKVVPWTQESIYSALLDCIQLGLEPDTALGFCYLIPYGSELTCQLGYQGLMQLAYRSGLVQKIICRTVHKGDKFNYDAAADEMHHELTSEDDRVFNNMTHAYARAWLKGGQFPITEVMTKSQIDQHRKRYVKFNNKETWGDAMNALWMSKKTVIIQLIKMLPKSKELSLAYQVEVKNNPFEDARDIDTAEVKEASQKTLAKIATSVKRVVKAKDTEPSEAEKLALFEQEKKENEA